MVPTHFLIVWISLVLVAVKGGGERGRGGRCLIVSVDNRDLQDGYLDQHYPSMTAVINHAYADYHGYDFYYVQNDVADLVKQVLQKYPHAKQDEMMLNTKSVAKDVATGFNVGLQQFRAASWAKLPALWHVVQSWGHKYDYIWYIDSDATISPHMFNRTIEGAMAHWQSQNAVVYGQKDLTKAKLIFFNNHPWRDNMPCAGSFIMNMKNNHYHHHKNAPISTNNGTSNSMLLIPPPGRFHPGNPSIESILREWWDFDMSVKNFKHFHEQDALWHMIDHDRGLSNPEFNDRWQAHADEVGRYYTNLRRINSTDNLASNVATQPSTTDPRHLSETNEVSTIKRLASSSGNGASGVSLGSKTLPGTRFRINNATFAVLKERQFPSPFIHYEDNLWLLHIASYNYLQRMPILYQSLGVLGISPDVYKERVQHIIYKHILHVGDPLKVCEDMEATSQLEERQRKYSRVTMFPPHNLQTQDQWYDDHVTSRTETPLSAAEQYEGRLVRRKHEFWLVYKGEKWEFANFGAFLACEVFRAELGFPLSTQEVAQIPTSKYRITDTLCQQPKKESSSSSSSGKKTGTSAGEEPTGGVTREQLLRFYLPIHLPAKSQKSKGSFNRSHSLAANSSSLHCAGTVGSEDHHDSGSDHAGPENVHLFVVAHNNESVALARSFVECHGGSSSTIVADNGSRSSDPKASSGWMSVLPIPSTVFFESILYASDQLPQWIAAQGSRAPEHIITATYKTVAKSLSYNAFTQNLDMILHLHQTAVRQKYDVLPFLRSGSDLKTFVNYWHGPAYFLAWDALLAKLNYTETQIRAFDRAKVVFYRNIYVIRTSVFLALSQFMQRAMTVASTDPHVMSLLKADSKYKEGNAEVAQRIFGSSYYQLHPFIFERLPSFFLYTEGYKICAAETGPCKYNS